MVSLPQSVPQTAGRLYSFFNEFFFFFCHLRIYHETSMCQTTSLVHKKNLCEGNNDKREGSIRQKDALSLLVHCLNLSSFGPLNTGMFLERYI